MPGLGLFNVAIVNPTYLFTNNDGAQMALRWNVGSFAGQISPIGLGSSFMSNNNDLSTLNLGYSATATRSQWRTDIGATPLQLASGDYFNAGQDLGTEANSVTISSVPEPSAALLWGAGAMGIRSLRRRRSRVLGVDGSRHGESYGLTLTNAATGAPIQNIIVAESDITFSGLPTGLILRATVTARHAAGRESAASEPLIMAVP
jgi:hypothetical protein